MIETKRDTRLLNKESFDDPSEFLQAGSTEEHDMISEWTTSELVDTIQDLDEKLFIQQKETNQKNLIIKYLENFVEFCNCGNPKDDCVCPE